MRGLGSTSSRGNIVHCSFLFSRSKTSDANIGITVLPTLFDYEKARLRFQCPGLVGLGNY